MEKLQCDEAVYSWLSLVNLGWFLGCVVISIGNPWLCLVAWPILVDQPAK